MKPALTVFGCILLAATPLAAQNPQRVADGVRVLAVPARTNTPAHNVGWVEFDNYLLIVDGGSGETWSEVREAVRASAAKPARFVVHTYGSRDTADSATPEGMTRLVQAASHGATGSGQLLSFPTSIALAAGSRSVELRGVDGAPAGGAASVFVVTSGVLFAGDLVGSGRGSAPLPLDAWIRSLERLERLDPSVVVPGSGPVGGPDLLATTRQALLQLRTRVAAAVKEGETRDQVLRSVTADEFALLPAGTVGRVFDEIVGLQPATAFVAGLGLEEGATPTATDPVWTPPSKVVVADLWPGRTGQLGQVAPGVELVVVADPQQAAAAATDADAVLGWLTPEILSGAQRLRWVQLPAAGVERYLAIPGFVASDVVLTNAQRIFAPGGAEHVLAMVLALSRRLHTALSLQRDRRWDTTPLTGPAPYSGDGSELLELRGRTLLVVGLGGIGTEVARLAHGIGMRVIATRGSRREGPPFVEYVGLSSELLTLTPQADVIVNSVPFTPATDDMFDTEFFARTKPTAFFINIGRGRTVETDALTQALRDGRIAGAGLDVTDPEPLPVDHELWGMPNVIITPHIGGDSDGHMERLWLLFRENLRRFANGEPLLSVVDKRRGY
jgi:phosphoglycerate dehydrogenase-like enzyme